MMRKIGAKTPQATEGDKEGARLADYTGTNYTSLASKALHTDSETNAEDLPPQLYHLPHISEDQQTIASSTISDSASSIKTEVKVGFKICFGII